ncbi:MAG: helix-turn-helix domain-containing protein [Reyranellaceae bacterium]
MTDAPDAALDGFLGLVAERGYAAVALRDVAQRAGLGLAELYRRYPDKSALVAGFLARIDAEVVAGTPATSDPEETVRDRLFDVLMRRFDALRPHRAAVQAVRRASLSDPLLALSLAPAIRRSMGAMLEAAGVPSDGVAGALRQSGLLAVYQAVWQVFERDETADASKTMAALDDRLKRAERWIQLFDKYMKRPEAKRPETASEITAA